MLIRICGHFINNPASIDKLICIKGLPEDWIFRSSRFGGKELVSPWIPDIEVNIPASIRHLCEPVEITQVFSPIEKGRDYVVDKKTIIGLKFDYMTEPGQVLWEKIERYLDQMTPRDQRVPVPVLVAPDHKSVFNPHEARRTVRGSLELRPAEIPVVDLNRIIVAQEITSEETEKAEYERLKAKFGITQPAVSASVVRQVEPTPEAPPVALPCDFPGCNKVFDTKIGVSAHKRFGHKKETIGVGG